MGFETNLPESIRTGSYSRHLSLITYHLSLITYHLSLIIHHALGNSSDDLRRLQPAARPRRVDARPPRLLRAAHRCRERCAGAARLLPYAVLRPVAPAGARRPRGSGRH